jgi:hypothetical protein
MAGDGFLLNICTKLNDSNSNKRAVLKCRHYANPPTVKRNAGTTQCYLEALLTDKLENLPI